MGNFDEISDSLKHFFRSLNNLENDDNFKEKLNSILINYSGACEKEFELYFDNFQNSEFLMIGHR